MYSKRRYIAAVLASTLLVLPAGPAAQALALPRAGGVAIDASAFPDAAFRAWLLDGRNLDGAGADSLLTAIDLSALPALRLIHINYNQLTQLDLSRNQALEGGGFIAEDNNLSKLILPVLPSMAVSPDSFQSQTPSPKAPAP